MESAIISACLASREAFNLTESLETSSDLSPDGIEIYRHITNYYKSDDNTQAVDVDVLLKQIEIKKPHSYEKLSTVLRNLPEASTHNLTSLLVDQRLRRIGTDMTAALSVGDTAKTKALATEYAQVHELGLSSEGTHNTEYEVYQGVGLHTLTQAIREGADVKLLPGLLDHIVFNMMPGDHVVVFGPVNAGKSAVCVQAACDYAYDGHTVLYVGNEDPANRMLIRVVCNLCGVPLSAAEEDEEGYTSMAKEEGYNNIIFVSLAPGSVEDIDKLCKKYKPTVCIVDQARNLAPAKRKGAFDDNQAEVFYQLRMLYKRHQLIGISLTQAADKDDRGKPLSGKIKLEQRDVFGSKVEVAAQADVMIGVGATEQMKANGQLFLNVCKNKASGVHDGVYVFLDPQTSSLKGN